MQLYTLYTYMYTYIKVGVPQLRLKWAQERHTHTHLHLPPRYTVGRLQPLPMTTLDSLAKVAMPCAGALVI